MSSMAYTCLLFIFLPSLSLSVIAKQVYIVHVDHHSKPESFSTHHEWYVSTLRSHTSSTIQDSLIYTYTHGFHGFAAYIDREEAESLKQRDFVIDVYENRVFSVHTTRTPEFLGLDGNVEFGDSVGGYKNFVEIDQATHGIVIGVLDTGVWPESKSFDDIGMPDIPKNWRGVCEIARDFSPKLCNKKLIGARSSLETYFRLSNNTEHYASPRDTNGHGTHTSSTAAGSLVVNASLFSYASGMARGMASHARIASYRVCWNSSTCYTADVLDGVIQAVSDGCHVLSMSLGAESEAYYQDPIAIAAFYATQMGVAVSSAAGNDGPNLTTVSNTAPWMITVGAATLDRTFMGHVLLGNKKRLRGASLSNQRFGNKPSRLVYTRNNQSSHLCMPGSLDPTLVHGKLVICDDHDGLGLLKSIVVKFAGGVGMILVEPKRNASGEIMEVDNHVLPTVVVENRVGNAIKKYAKSNPRSSASLSYGETVYNVKPAPIIASFSSRGPNTVVPQVLKPDLVAPGVNILAAWPSSVSITGLNRSDPRRSNYNIVSGTSMACPHVSGFVALLKVVHPNWSPSAIKSALMTTAYTIDNTKSPLTDFDGRFSTPLAHGAGHVNPQKALSPGLVYDISAEEYRMFFCSLNYPEKNVQKILKAIDAPACSKNFSDPGQLNYPSFSIVFENGKRVVRYTRKLTNVGPARSVYDVTVTAPSSVTVTIKPMRLVFKDVGDRERYTVTFVAKKGAKPASNFASGFIVWSNPHHQVTSPGVFTWK